MSFYDGGAFLFSPTGLEVDILANGDQGAGGTFYVNINSDTPFDRVVASSTAYAFEFDNVALVRNPIPLSVIGVPKPGTQALLVLGLLGSIAARRRRPE